MDVRLTDSLLCTGSSVSLGVIVIRRQVVFSGAAGIQVVLHEEFVVHLLTS